MHAIRLSIHLPLLLSRRPSTLCELFCYAST
jgi:hypothetical protein